MLRPYRRGGSGLPAVVPVCVGTKAGDPPRENVFPTAASGDYQNTMYSTAVAAMMTPPIRYWYL